MSYDLVVATHDRSDIPADEQRAAVPFQIGGPFQVEIDDLPQLLAQAVLAPSWQVEHLLYPSHFVGARKERGHLAARSVAANSY